MSREEPNTNPVPPGWTVIARLIRARGIKGEISAESWSSRPERFDDLQQVTLWPSGQKRQVQRVWWHGDRPVFQFDGIHSMTEAEPLAGELVSVPVAERVELEPGEVFYGDLVGCEVYSPAGLVGRVDDYQENGAQILLEVGPHLIPFVPAICVRVDTAGRRIDVELPEGFLELNS